MSIAKGLMVEIKWLDSHGVTSEWEFKDEIKAMLPCECTTLGYLEAETEEYVTIFQSQTDKQVLGRMTIPKCSILSMVTCKAI